MSNTKKYPEAIEGENGYFYFDSDSEQYHVLGEKSNHYYASFYFKRKAIDYIKDNFSDNKNITQQIIKDELSKLLYEISDHSIQKIVRETIFSHSENVDWEKVLETIKIQRPEMKIL